jgi:hypothetical protein
LNSPLVIRLTFSRAASELIRVRVASAVALGWKFTVMVAGLISKPDENKALSRMNIKINKRRVLVFIMQWVNFILLSAYSLPHTYDSVAVAVTSIVLILVPPGSARGTVTFKCIFPELFVGSYDKLQNSIFLEALSIAVYVVVEQLVLKLPVSFAAPSYI